MRGGFGIVVAVVGGSASGTLGQDVYLSASRELFGDGETLTFDIVLDATRYTGDFFAWHSFEFEIYYAADGSRQDIGNAIGGVLDESNFAETADTTGFAAGGLAWTGGRRPGAFPGSASDIGGSRFGDTLADIVNDRRIGSTRGLIAGRQQAFTAPENNPLINSNRVYEAFRFEFTYDQGFGSMVFLLGNVRASVYTSEGTVESAVDVDLLSVGSWSTGIYEGPLPPAPGTVSALAVAGVVASRRRRAGLGEGRRVS